MIEWEVSGTTLRVVASDSSELSVHGTDLVVTDATPAIPRPVEDTLLARASELVFPHAVVYAFRDDDTQYELDPHGTPLSLPAGTYTVDIDTAVKAYLHFSGEATITQTRTRSHIVVSFPTPTRVAIGFRSRNELPTDTITVPDDPDALATALSHLSVAHKTDSPNRSYPSLRGHPPLLELGDTLSIPATVQSATPQAGIELSVPPTYETLFTIAPLAYYLQATVTTRPNTSPTLSIPDCGIETELTPNPTLETTVSRLLRKVFFLDCLVRNAGPYSTRLSELSLLDALELDDCSLYHATPAERLETYLSVPHEAIEHRLPEWHLSTYVTPTYTHVETLPFLLDKLSLIYQPRTSELEGRELIKRSLDDFYRVGAGQVAAVEMVKPELQTGRVHGWLADGVPIDVFKSTPEAYHNRLSYLECPNEEVSITVVLNDPEMSGEHERVAEIYRKRAQEMPIELTVNESVTTDALARTLERGTDFLHYIGHCERDGLRCPDGYLSTASIDTCHTQTFFLNACGSFREGLELVKRGSVAGAVTFQKVLNEHAVKVGSTFAKLLVHGFSIERAMRLARRRIMMGKDYAVVGDGTHALTDGDHRIPTTLTIDPLEDGQYFVTFDCYATATTGSYYFPHTADNEYASLCGSESHFVVSGDELASLLEETAAAVIYDGDLYWSETVAGQFRT